MSDRFAWPRFGVRLGVVFMVFLSMPSLAEESESLMPGFLRGAAVSGRKRLGVVGANSASFFFRSKLLGFMCQVEMTGLWKV